MSEITLCAHCGKSDWHKNMNLHCGEFICNDCLKSLTKKVVLGKCEYCEFPIYDGDSHYETADKKLLHEICYPKMAYYKMREWRMKNE